jgi:Skp family chaperone for outer membrane proteins
METLLKSDKALDILTTISLAQFLVIAVIFIGIGATIFKFKDRIKDFLEDYRTKENRKEDLLDMLNSHEQEIQDLKAHHEDDMKKFYNKQLEYRKQSMTKQDKIDNRFDTLEGKFDALVEMVANHYEETKRLKRNELRDKLLTSYRHFTSLELNPKQEWNEMEAEAFWNVFGDYEELGGNGFMHSIVKPAMEKLTVTKIL